MITHSALEHVISVFDDYGKKSGSADIKMAMAFVVGVLHNLNNGLTHDPENRTPDWLAEAFNSGEKP